MGNILSNIGNTVANITTLGGHSRVKSAQSLYQNKYYTYENRHKKYGSLIAEHDGLIESIGHKTQDAMVEIEEVEFILRQFTEATAKIKDTRKQESLDALDKILTLNASIDSAASIMTGTAAGSAAAVGSWAVVSMIGSASTGTALTSLSGAAATNATLAWFGGGSIATGGAGMVGGATVIGGIVALPIIAFSSWKTHESAAELEKADELVDNINKITPIIKNVQSQLDTLSAGVDRLIKAKNNTRKKLYPFGIFSRFIKWFKVKIGKDYYETKDIPYVQVLEREISIFMALLNKNTEE